MLRRLSNLILPTSMLALATMGGAAQAQELDIQNIDLPVTVVQPPLPVNLTEHPGKELVVIGVDDNAQRTLVILVQDECCNGWKVFEQKPLDRSWITFDYGEREDGGIESLYFLNKSAVHQYIPGQAQNAFQHVIDIKSTYLVSDVDFIHRTRFVYDLNKDSVDDFLLSSFETVNVGLSNSEGAYSPQILPIHSEVDMFSGSTMGSLTFRRPNIHVQDANGDELEDIVYIRDGSIILYEQGEKGFERVGQVISANKDLKSRDWYAKDEEDGDSASQGSLSYHKVLSVRDINGDGALDIIALHSTSSSVFDRDENLEFYWGKMVEGNLTFDAQPNSVIGYTETISGVNFSDLNEDGEMEVLVSSLKLGLRKVVAALFSGHVGQDVYVFRLNENGVFEEQPVSKEKVNLSFSLSDGSTGDPLTKLADFNGDGFLDLILSDGDDGIEIFDGIQSESFARRSQTYDFTLPNNSFRVAVDDLNLDGKDDLVFYYGRLDDEQLRNTIAIVKGR